MGICRARGRISVLFLSAAIAALGSAAQAEPRSEAGDEAVVVDTVVVTATRRSTDIQEVPFSITAFGGEALEKADVSNITELTNVTPGLQRPGGSAGGALSLRGAYGRSSFPGVDQDVGLFIDEVSVAGLADMDQEFFDLDRIEVLRGPQGTLFGRNVTGGAVSIHTRRPSFTPETKVQVGYGNYDDYRVSVLRTGPLSDTAAYKVVLSARGHEGYFNNFIVGGDTGDIQTLTGRAQLLLRPSDKMDILFGAELFNRDGDTVTQLIGTAQPGLVWPTVSFDEDDSSQYLGPDHPNGYVRTRGRNLLGRLEWDLEFATLTSISAYRELNERVLTAGVGDPLNSDPVRQPSRYDQFTHEMRLTSPTDRRLRWVAGLYYLDGFRSFQVLPIPDYRMFGPPYSAATVPAIANLLAWTGYYHPGAFYKQANDSHSRAVFAEVNFDLTSTLTATLGGRYTWESKEGFAERSNTTAYLIGPPISAHYEGDWSAFTPKATLTYEPTEDLLFYATAARGFKSGGFDSSTPSTVAGLQTPTNPTYVWNYEAGVKAALLDRRLIANLSIFRMDYTDLQVAIFDPLAVSFAFKNAGKARNDGVELDLRAKPASWLTLGGAYTYQDAEYVDYIIPNAPPAPPTVNSGNRMIQTPEHALSLYADAEWSIGDAGTISIGGSVLFRGPVYLTDTNADPAYVQDNTEINGLVDLHAAWTSPDDAWKLAAWGANMTDERYLLYSVDVSSLYRSATDPLPNSIRLASWNPPRTFGVTLTRRF